MSLDPRVKARIDATLDAFEYAVFKRWERIDKDKFNDYYLKTASSAAVSAVESVENEKANGPRDL